MTLEEKRSFVKEYCDGRKCEGCAVGAIAESEYEEGVSDAVICYKDATERQLDRRIDVIKSAQSSVENVAPHIVPVKKTAAQLSDEIAQAKAEMCEEHCRGYKNCNDCPCKVLAEHKHDGSCEFEEFSEGELDEYLKNFAAEEETRREFTKVASIAEAEPVDNVHPQHYKLPGGMEVIDVEVAMFGKEAVMHHCFCTAAEYILRHMQKNGVEDIKKAHWWLEKYIELEASE